MLVKRTPSTLWTVLVVVITLAWAVNLVGPWVVSTFRPDPSINNLFMVVIGGLVAVQVERAEGRKRTEPESQQGDTP